MNTESITYSLRNLRHRKGRSFMTVFSILVGIATIFIFISFGYGLYEYTNSFTTGTSANKILILAKGSNMGIDDSFRLNDDDLKAVKSSGGVFGATGTYYDAAQVESKNQLKYVYITSYDPNVPILLDIFGVGLDEGRLLKNGDKALVAGYNYKVDGKIFDKGLELNDALEVNGEKIRIVGFMESVGNPQDDSNIYVTNDYFLDLYPDKENYAEIIAEVDLENIEQVISNVERSLRNERNLERGKEDFFVQSFEDLIDSYSGALNVIIGFVILIALISVLVSAVNTANTMITSVLERYKEIGVLKAIGARNSEIFNIFLFESSFLGLVAGILGVLLGWGITSLAGLILTSLGWGFLQPSNSIWIFVGCILFATLTGAISGVLPAIRASKINPVNALRYE
ncbi:MAG: ABC transporter permease [Nanoarchaeota archaeon]|nr:ABC transporter permease [Nanoarchaeota archaeon]